MAITNPFASKKVELVTSKAEFDKAKEVAKSVEVVKVEEIKPAELAEPERQLTRKEAILKKYGGIPSNIPVNHPYWKM